ncbi:MAG: pre-peptidase C-terminal domain-containing protein [Phycisphaerae bacterium]
MALSLGGCPVMQPTDMPPNNNAAPNLDKDGNFSFATATELDLSSDSLRFRGRIEGDTDADLFSIGSLNAGDRLRIDVERLDGNLDAVAAVFDADENLLSYNDDRAADNSNRDPLIDFVLPGDGSREIIFGIVNFSGSGTSGNYEVLVTITRGEGAPDPRGQVVFLDYRGGTNIQIPQVGVFDLLPFDAADFGPTFRSRTAEIKDNIEAIVKDRYVEFNLLLLNSDDHPKPAVPHSTIYFGESDARAFAISEQIDTLNQDLEDDAIVFTESYRDAFSGTPTVAEISNAVGNTVAHEIGHLLGLVHTADCGELMDATCGNDRILSKQTFGTARLDTFVFPVGNQDALLLLEWVLGLAGLG